MTDHAAQDALLFAARRMLATKRAEQHLLDFMKLTMPDPEDIDDASMSRYEETPVARLLCQIMEKVYSRQLKRVCVSVGPQLGKALEVSTPIPTPDGWKPIGELRPGDRVFSEQGTVCNVVAVSEVWKNRQLYAVRSDDRHVVYADGEHEWMVRASRSHPVLHRKTTKQLAERTAQRKVKLPPSGALDLPEAELPIHPYVLGAWLGDGGSDGCGITAVGDDGKWLAAEIERCGETIRWRKDGRSFGVMQLTRKLIDNNLQYNKHIPQQYLRASIEQRVALLHGLMDTDGYVPGGVSALEYCSIIPELATGVQELVHSLGFKCVVSSEPARLYGKDCGTRHRVLFYMPDAARMPRKAAKCPTSVKKTGRYLSVEAAGVGDTVCIQVDSPSHLFLCGHGMLPTHNSQVISRGGPAWMLAKNPYLNIILGTYNQPFANEFGDAVREIMNSPSARQIFEGVYLRKGGKAKDLLITMSGGRAAFVGRGGSGTGKPADIFIVDDPLKDDIEAQSDSTREEVWNWFNKVALTRCHDKSSILVVHCMTGDTPVTMGDGTRRRLDTVRPGDEVLAWDKGEFARKKVLNFAEQGEDDVLEIRTGSSRVRANARHPFLCMRMGEAVWVKAGELRVGDMLVTSAVEPGTDPARLTPTESWLLGFMFGDGWLTQRNGMSKSSVNGKMYPRRAWVACAAFSKNQEEDAIVEQAFRDVFGFIPKRTRFGYWRTERADVCRWFVERGMIGKAKTKVLPQWMFAQPADVRRAFVEGMLHADGTIDKKKQSVIAGANEGLISDFRHLARSVGICVSNTHSWSGRVQPPNSPEPVDTTIWSFKWGLAEQSKAFHTKPIRSITAAGREVVYDIQVEGAENFIADGLVTHNTRWHQDDLIGRLCDPDHPERNGKYKGIAERWTHINLPAVVDDPKLAKALGLTLEPPTDPFVISMFGTKPMSSLWPNRKGLPFLAEAKQQDKAGFGALYMGQPTPEDGDYFKAADLVEYNTEDLPDSLTIYGASDHAVGLKQRNDSTVLGCIGVDEKDDIWVLPSLVWGKMPTDQTVEELIQQFKNQKPMTWWMESEMISKSFGPFLLKRMEEEGVYTPIEPVIASKDKSTRGRSIQGRIQMRKVHFPRDAVWWPEARRQMLMFPNGAHDDFVDWLGHIGQGLMKQIAPDAKVMQNERQAVRTGSIEWILRRAQQRADREKIEKQAVGW